MIDERFLQNLVDEAMAGVDPPTDGAERIRLAAGVAGVDDVVSLAGAGEERSGRRFASWIRARLSTRTRVGVGVAAVVAVVAVVAMSVALIGSAGGRSPAGTSTASGRTGGAVGTGIGTNRPAASAGPTPGAMARSAAASGGAASGASGSGTFVPAAPSSTGAATSSGAPPASGSAVPNEVPSMSTKVIKTGSISLLAPVGHLQDLLSRASAEADGLGGYVQASNSQTPAGTEVPSGSVTLEVPVAQFQNLVNYVQKLGKNLSVTTAGRDVTTTYVDLQARLTALQGTRTQFEQILSQATSIPDILSVESQISDVETQIEQIQGQIQVTDQQTSYSTLTVQVSEAVAPGRVVTPPKPPSGIEKSWQHARGSFTHGVEAVIGALGGVAVFLIFAGALLLLARIGWGLVRRRLV